MISDEHRLLLFRYRGVVVVIVIVVVINNTCTAPLLALSTRSHPQTPGAEDTPHDGTSQQPEESGMNEEAGRNEEAGEGNIMQSRTTSLRRHQHQRAYVGSTMDLGSPRRVDIVPTMPLPAG